MTQERNVRFDEYIRREFFVALAFTTFAAILLSLLFVQFSTAQEPGERTFHSANEAGSALFTAAQNENEKALLDILGPAGKEIISSGDPAEDMNERVGFVEKYQEMHRFAKEADGITVLYVGAENWPFPIPLLNKNGTWYFDTDAGKQEILMRRIGRNELAAIDACRQLVAAENQYNAKALPDGSINQYAVRFVSAKGQHNGLFWPEAADQFDSLVDPLIAASGQDDTTSGNAAGDPIPFNGYFFRILKSQGKDAPGGAKSYLVNGKMVGGFAFVAYPAEYRSSGVITFIVDQSGVVREKDLGPNTVAIATNMTDYNPDSTWHPVD